MQSGFCSWTTFSADGDVDESTPSLLPLNQLSFGSIFSISIRFLPDLRAGSHAQTRQYPSEAKPEQLDK